MIHNIMTSIVYWLGVQFGSIPLIVWFFIILISLLMALYLLHQARKGSMTKMQAVAGMLVIPYLLILLESMVFSRIGTSDRVLELVPFWSYKIAMVGDGWMVVQIVANIVVMMPFGFLLPILMPVLPKRKKFLYTLLLGLAFSIMIELLQYSFRCGWVELDDIFDNCLGTLLGALIWLFQGMR